MCVCVVVVVIPLLLLQCWEFIYLSQNRSLLWKRFFLPTIVRAHLYYKFRAFTRKFIYFIQRHSYFVAAAVVTTVVAAAAATAAVVVVIVFALSNINREIL